MVNRFTVLYLSPLIMFFGCTPITPLVIEEYDGNQKKTVELVKIKSVGDHTDTTRVEVQQYYSNGILAYSMKYNLGKPHGKHSVWHSNGNIKLTGKYKNGLRTGKWQYFDSRGRIDSVHQFVQGKTDGKYYQFDNDGKKIVKGVYVYGKKQGKWTWIGSDGMKDSIRTFYSDKLNGIYIDYYQTGSLKKKAEYTLDNLNGDYCEYKETGERSVEGEYRNSVPNGQWIWWKDGEKTRSVGFADGIKDGKFIVWESGKIVKIKGEFLKDRKHGIWRWWNHNGELDSMRTFYDGLLDGVAENYLYDSAPMLSNLRNYFIIHFDMDIFKEKTGLSKRSFYKNDIIDGKVIEWFPNRMKKNHSVYSYGLLNGLQTEWYSNGNQKSLHNWSEGIKNGKYSLWYTDGTMMERGRFIGGKYNGKIQRWYSTGIKSSESTFQDGVQHGIMRVFNPSGIQRKEVFYIKGHSICSFEYYDDSQLKEFTYFQDGESKWSSQWDKYGAVKYPKGSSLFLSMKDEYYLSGNPKRKTTFKNGIRHGFDIQYFENRDIKYLSIYQDGDRIIERKYTQGDIHSVDRIFKDGKEILVLDESN